MIEKTGNGIAFPTPIKENKILAIEIRINIQFILCSLEGNVPPILYISISTNIIIYFIIMR